VLELESVGRDFGGVVSLDAVSLRTRGGEIHALLGPNGAGKTTLLRILAGLVVPSRGSVQLDGIQIDATRRRRHPHIGLVPSGDRTFYLRLSGFENLVFFARMQGFRHSAAKGRAHELLEAVGLESAAMRRVGEYSHGMQKRLSVARALLAAPSLLLVDEATHDLDPAGANLVKGLVRDVAADGAVVIWATQRLDEIRAFADSATVLDRGRTRFNGALSDLLARSEARRYLLELREASGAPAFERAATATAAFGTISPAGTKHVLLTLAPGVLLGQAFVAMAAADVDVVSCREERSQVEDAFLRVVGDRS
jgi:ABC-2 type transport system ATP-binding protein